MIQVAEALGQQVGLKRACEVLAYPAAVCTARASLTPPRRRDHHPRGR
jgi:hypothetical protein